MLSMFQNALLGPRSLDSLQTEMIRLANAVANNDQQIVSIRRSGYTFAFMIRATHRPLLQTEINLRIQTIKETNAEIEKRINELFKQIHDHYPEVCKDTLTRVLSTNWDDEKETISYKSIVPQG